MTRAITLAFKPPKCRLWQMCCSPCKKINWPCRQRSANSICPKSISLVTSSLKMGLKWTRRRLGLNENGKNWLLQKKSSSFLVLRISILIFNKNSLNWRDCLPTWPRHQKKTIGKQYARKPLTFRKIVSRLYLFLATLTMNCNASLKATLSTLHSVQSHCRSWKDAASISVSV